MSAPFLIIDGYNLLHAAGLARVQYGPGDLERARHRLASLLAEKLRAEERQRCLVVFDAQQAPTDVPRQSQHHGITLQFAPPGQDADTAIEQLVATHPAGRRMIVVSGDHRLQKAAKRRNAVPIDSDAFLVELNKRESVSPLKETAADAMPQQPKRREKPTVGKEDWQATFGEIDVKSLEAEVGQEVLPGLNAPDQEVDLAQQLQRQLEDQDWLERWLKE